MVKKRLADSTTLKEIGYLATGAALAKAGADPLTLNPSDERAGRQFVKERGRTRRLRS